MHHTVYSTNSRLAILTDLLSLYLYTRTRRIFIPASFITTMAANFQVTKTLGVAQLPHSLQI